MISLFYTGFYLIFQGKSVQAAASDNVSGWAWSETIGWISFNNTSGGGATSYGVNINTSTGSLSGYAWSENVGWIMFNPPPDVTTGTYPGSPAYSATLNTSTNAITGWARACAGTTGGNCTSVTRSDGWDGWIKLDGVTRSVCELTGWAWGSDVVGWISFNSKNIGSAPNPYAVTSTFCSVSFVPTYVINPASVTKQVSQTQQFTGWYDPDGPSGAQAQQDRTTSASWSSSNAAVASITSSGLATCVAAGGPITITSVYSGITATATLTCSNLPTYLLSVTRIGTGSVTSAPSGINCPLTSCSVSYTSGSSVTLTAAADSGSTFAGWSGDADCSDGVVTMSAAKTCNATFTLSAVPDFSIQPPPSPATIRAPQNGTSQSMTLTIKSSNGFNSAVGLLIVAGLPAGAAPVFSPSSVTPPANGSASATLKINTTNVAAGSYPLTVRGTSGSLTHDTTVTLIVVNLAVDLKVSTNSSNWQDALSGHGSISGVDFQATISGSALTPYLLDFDCTNDGIWDGSQVNSAITPVTVTNRCNYPSVGTYTARVRVQADVANWAYDTVTISVTNNAPSAVLTNPPTQPDYCTNPPMATFNWAFSDPDGGDTQSAYQVQVDNNNTFASPEADSGKVTSTSNSYSTGSGKLTYNNTYYWRVMVWDNYGLASAWISGASFTTPQHKYPTPGFTVPSEPSAEEEVQFIAAGKSICYNISNSPVGCKSWLWNIVPSPTYNPSRNVENPKVTFSTSGGYQAQITVTDLQNYACTGNAIGEVGINKWTLVDVKLPLPGWQEKPPSQ